MNQSSASSLTDSLSPNTANLDLLTLEVLSDQQAELLSGGANQYVPGFKGPLASFFSCIQQYFCRKQVWQG